MEGPWKNSGSIQNADLRHHGGLLAMMTRPVKDNML